MRDRKCKSSLNQTEYKFYKMVIRGVCTSCESNYYLDKFNMCPKSPNCSKVKNNLCTECLQGFQLGLYNICTNVEKCIYTNNDNECENVKMDIIMMYLTKYVM